jgi:hypothetical protein
MKTLILGRRDAFPFQPMAVAYSWHATFVPPSGWVWLKRIGLVAAYFGALLVFVAAARVPLVGVAATVGSFAAMGIAGVVCLLYLVPNLNSLVCLFFFGPILGLVVGRLVLLACDLCFGPSFATAALTLALLPAIALAVLRVRPSAWPKWSEREVDEFSKIAGLNAAVLLAMSVAYWGVGRLTAGGYAFAPYFFLDFLSHAACSSELARQVPPENPYFAGQIFHYYWFYHLWPAAIINLSGVTARSAVALTQPINAFLFVGAVVCLGKLYIPRFAAHYMAVGIGLFAFSYIGIFFILRNAQGWFSEFIIRVTGTSFSYLSHSWYRDFLYEPHAVTAMSGLVLVTYLESASLTRKSWRTGLLAGLMLGDVAVTDLFVGMIALVWFASMNGQPFLRQTQSRLAIAVASLVAVSIVLGAFALQLFPARTGQLRFGLHGTAKYAPIYLFVELGPLFVFGGFGLYLCLRRHQFAVFRPVLLLFVIALVVAFTVIVPIEINQVIRKSIKVVQIPLVVFAAVACDVCIAIPGRDWLRWAGVGVVGAGFLTLCTDAFQYSDIQPSSKTCTASFVSTDRMAALEWIRDQTPTDSIVQLLDEVRPTRKVAINFDISVPAISERRTLFGNYKYLYLTHVGKGLIDNRKSILENVFTARSGGELKKSLDRLPQFYLLVDDKAPGPRDAVRKLVKSHYLEEVFRSGSVSVLWKTDNGQQVSFCLATDRTAVSDRR